MGMTRSKAVEVMIGRHREALAQAKLFRCACCEQVLSVKEASHVDAYVAHDPVMKQAVPKENIATYVICQECARMPEATVRLKVERYLVANGLLQKDLKPLDAPGGHSPGHQKDLFPGRG